MHLTEELKSTYRRDCSRRWYRTNCALRRGCRSRFCRLRLYGESCRSSCTRWNQDRYTFYGW